MKAQCMLLIVLLAYKANAVKFEISNKESGPIWVGIQGNAGHIHLNDGGLVLKKNETKVISAPNNWAGRFWPRTWCNSNSKHCLTGSCNDKIKCRGAGGTPPATLIEVKLKGWKGLDYYDISLVDGFNLRASIKPVNGKGPKTKYSCTQVKCQAHINQKCPKELQVRHKNMTIACNSACNKFKTDEYCCTGTHNRPKTCKSSTWPKNYAAFFKRECPQAYSYAYDDKKSTFTCKASHYKIQFGVGS